MIISGYNFVAAIGIFLALLLLIAGYFYLQSRRRPAAAGWEDLISKLTWVDRDDIAEVALDLVDESGEPRASEDAGCMEPSQMWDLIGGLYGLTILEKNSDVLIAL